MSVKIGLILASIREGRVGEMVAKWMLEESLKVKDKDVEIELIDLKDYKLPFVGVKRTEEETKAVSSWQAKMTEMDGYILVTPEYNRTIPGSLSNAFQLLYPEVANKPLAFVGYGHMGAASAIDGFRAGLSILEVAIVQKTIRLSFNVDFKGFGTKDVQFTPGSWHQSEIKRIMEQLTNWTKALKLVRENKL